MAITERPTPISWLAFLAVGLIGSVLAVSTFASASTGAVPLLAIGLGAVLAVAGTLEAWLEASALDAEAQR